MYSIVQIYFTIDNWTPRVTCPVTQWRVIWASLMMTTNHFYWSFATICYCVCP